MIVRKIALVAFIASILSILYPGWNLVQTVAGVESRGVSWWRLLPPAALALLLSAIMPVFYLALYRNQGTLFIPRPMRLLSRGAAIVAGLFVAAALRTEYLDSYFTIGAGSMNAATLSHMAGLLITFSEAALVLLLVSFCFQPSGASAADVPVSRFLDQATKLAVVVYGIVLAVAVFRVLPELRTCIQRSRTPHC